MNRSLLALGWIIIATGTIKGQPWGGYLCLDSRHDEVGTLDLVPLEIHPRGVTVELWFKLCDSLGPPDGSIVSFGNQFNWATALSINYTRPPAHGRLDVCGSPTAGCVQSPLPAPLNPGWHHLVLTYKKYSFGPHAWSLYLDGSNLIDDDNLELYFGGFQKVFLGRSNRPVAGDFDAFKGYVDELHVSDTIRYSGLSIPVPSAPFVPDAFTLLLIHFDDSLHLPAYTNAPGNTDWNLTDYSESASHLIHHVGIHTSYGSPNADTICPRSTLFGAGGSVFQWSPGSAFDDSTAQNPVVISGDTTLTISVIISDSTFCEFRYDTITCHVWPYPPVTTSGDTALCLGDTIQIGAAGGVSFQWLNPYNMSDSSQANPLVWPLTTTTYQVRVTDSRGCHLEDSVPVTVHINPPLTWNDERTLCPGDTFTLSVDSLFTQTVWSTGAINTNSIDITSPGTYWCAMVGVGGCPAADTMSVVAGVVHLDTFSVMSCESYYVFIKDTLTSDGIYTDTLTGSVGCDSVVSVDLAFVDSIVASIQVNACNSYEFDGQTLTASGQYTATFLSQFGCDSTVHLSLIVSPAVHTFPILSSCDSLLFGGQTITVSGTYSDTLMTHNGCDSIVTAQVTIVDLDTAVVQGGQTLSAVHPGGIYQWVDCSNGYAPIPGAVGQSFTPLVTGSYAVIISANGCSDTSSCYPVVVSSVTPPAHAGQFSVAPNPARHHIEIEGATGLVTIADMVGQVVVAASAQLTIDVSALSPGIYYLRDESGAVCKWVKQ